MCKIFARPYSTPENNRVKELKKLDTLKNQGSGTFKERAADGNRTRDLRTTNATLYRLSHSSEPRII